MSQRRTLILVAAILVAMVAGFLVWNYVASVEEDAVGKNELVAVWTVEAPIARGAAGEAAAEAITRSNIPKQFKPANAITKLEDLTGKVAVSDLAPGQVVVDSLFVDRSDPSARKSNSDMIRKIRGKDQMAITISVDQIAGVAHLVEPGDYVNILLRPTTPKTTGDSSVSEASLKGGSARFLYQKVEVLAVDTQFVPQAGQTAEQAAAQPQAQQRGLITLILPAKAAQYVASVDPAFIQLALVSRDYKPVPQQPIPDGDPIPAEDAPPGWQPEEVEPGQRLTPYGADGPDNAS